MQGSLELPHRAALDSELVKDLVEGRVSLAAALRQALTPVPAFQAIHNSFALIVPNSPQNVVMCFCA